MRIVLHAENDLEVTRLLEPEMIVETRDPEAAYSALQMFATSLALCSFSMLYGYGTNIGVDPQEITLRVRWGYATDDNRIANIDLSIDWPGLPESRRAAAERAASLCTLHKTLHQPPPVATHLHAQPATAEAPPEDHQANAPPRRRSPPPRRPRHPDKHP